MSCCPLNAQIVFYTVKPKRSKIKKLIVKFMFNVIGKSMVAVPKFDKEAKKEIDSWPENFVFGFVVQPFGPNMVIQKTAEGTLKVVKKKDVLLDLAIVFKNLDGAFRMTTLRIGVTEAYAEHRICVQGDVSLSMSLVRFLNIVEAYLLPRFILKRIMRKIPPLPVLRRYIQRLRLFSLTLLLGI
ncbi:MAG: hypothetical protein ACTSUF_02415 [Candidatus Heimdallarchaeaceae archaeon]